MKLEAQAKLHIQKKIQDGEYELVTSEILRFEIFACPIEIRRAVINEFIEKHSSYHVGAERSPLVRQMARAIMTNGLKYKDACHVASAVIAGCDYLITTDKRMAKYKNDKIKLVTPIEFVMETEGEK